MKRIPALAAAAVLLATPALAQFQIEGSTTASQQVELELLNTVRTGSIPAGSDRSVHEIGVNYGALKYWNAGLSVIISNPVNGSVSVDGLRWTSKIGIFGGEASQMLGDVSLAIYTDVLFDFGTPNQTILTIGPALGVDLAPVDLSFNGFMTIPLSGPNDLGFRYAAGAMYDVSPSIAVGVEAHGEVPNVFANRPAVRNQEHVLGPAVNFTFEPEENRAVGVHLGTFFGLTDASPTVGVAANLEFGF